MELLDKKFMNILDFIENPVTNHHAGDKPVCYLTFDVKSLISVKRKLDAWISLAQGKGFILKIISIADVLNDFFKNNPRRNTWLSFDGLTNKEEVVELMDGLGSNVRENRIIENAILSAQNEILKEKQPLLIITDLEAIHPFSRFGPIEQNIYNQIEVPLIILYPGKLEGSSLEFLGFYPPDGNYRSKHF